MRESKIEKTLREGVEALGGTSEKFSPRGQIGRPDQLVSWPDAFAEFVETKAPDGKLESWQARDHKRRRVMGFHVHVIWTMEGVEAYLRTRGKK